MSGARAAPPLCAMPLPRKLASSASRLLDRAGDDADRIVDLDLTRGNIAIRVVAILLSLSGDKLAPEKGCAPPARRSAANRLRRRIVPVV